MPCDLNVIVIVFSKDAYVDVLFFVIIIENRKPKLLIVFE